MSVRAGSIGEPAGGTSEPAGDMESLLVGLRRLAHLADSAGEPQEIFRALAIELFTELGAEEVQVHHLAAEEDTVTVYMFSGVGRLGYLAPAGERSSGVAWVATSGRHVVLEGARELAASVPRLAAGGRVGCALLLPVAVRGEVQAVAILTRPRGGGRAGREASGWAGREASGRAGREASGWAGRRSDGQTAGHSDRFDEHAVARAATLVDQAANALALLCARAEAGTDPVTDCMNHRAMRRRLGEEIERATRTDGRLACLLIDLDNFKLVNDRHGHSAGDALLREVAQALMGEFRAFDRVARYGGDEFVVILAGADLESAATAAERARERMLGVSSFDLTPGVSASIGVAQWRPPMSTGMLLDACDAALLEGKRTGKGRVTRAA